MYFNILFGYVFKGGSKLYVFPNFWICRDTFRIFSRGRVYWLNCELDFTSIKNYQLRSSTVSTILSISLLVLSLKHLSKVFIITIFSLAAELLSGLPTVSFWSLVPSLIIAFSCLSFTVLPIIISRSKSSNWLRSFVFDCLFLGVETMLLLVDELQLKHQQWIKQTMNLWSGRIIEQNDNVKLKVFSLDEELRQLLCKKVFEGFSTNSFEQLSRWSVSLFFSLQRHFIFGPRSHFLTSYPSANHEGQFPDFITIFIAKLTQKGLFPRITLRHCDIIIKKGTE